MIKYYNFSILQYHPEDLEEKEWSVKLYPANSTINSFDISFVLEQEPESIETAFKSIQEKFTQLSLEKYFDEKCRVSKTILFEWVRSIVNINDTDYLESTLSWLPTNIIFNIEIPNPYCSPDSGSGNLIYRLNLSIDEQVIKMMNEVFPKALISLSWNESRELESLENPLQIFISRKSIQPDIDIAYRYALLLRSLGFRVWEESLCMNSGMMNQQMKVGIKDSMATVIIRTSDYDNTPGIQKELMLSLERKEKDILFEIIVLRIKTNDNLPELIARIKDEYQKEVDIVNYIDGIDFILRSIPYKIIRRLEPRKVL